jgi:epsilon-lactone hydrolase
MARRVEEKGVVMKKLVLLVGISTALVTPLGAGALLAPEARAQSFEPRELPARSIPVPDTVSPQLQKMTAVPVPPNWRDFPKTA